EERWDPERRVGRKKVASESGRVHAGDGIEDASAVALETGKDTVDAEFEIIHQAIVESRNQADEAAVRVGGRGQDVDSGRELGVEGIGFVGVVVSVAQSELMLVCDPVIDFSDVLVAIECVGTGEVHLAGNTIDHIARGWIWQKGEDLR